MPLSLVLLAFNPTATCANTVLCCSTEVGQRQSSRRGSDSSPRRRYNIVRTLDLLIAYSIELAYSPAATFCGVRLKGGYPYGDEPSMPFGALKHIAL